VLETLKRRFFRRPPPRALQALLYLPPPKSGLVEQSFFFLSARLWSCHLIQPFDLSPWSPCLTYSLSIVDVTRLLSRASIQTWMFFLRGLRFPFPCPFFSLQTCLPIFRSDAEVSDSSFLASGHVIRVLFSPLLEETCQTFSTGG